MRAFFRAIPCWVFVVLLSIGTSAQELQKMGRPPRLTIGVSATSDRTRIQTLLPQIRETIARTQSKARQSVRVLALQGSADAMEQARSAACNYLLDLKVSQLSKVELTVGRNRGQPQTERYGKNVEGEITVSYKVLALTGDPVDIQGNLRVHEGEYLLEDDPSAFDTFVFRATSSAAHTAIKKLKKTAGF